MCYVALGLLSVSAVNKTSAFGQSLHETPHRAHHRAHRTEIWHHRRNQEFVLEGALLSPVHIKPPEYGSGQKYKGVWRNFVFGRVITPCASWLRKCMILCVSWSDGGRLGSGY